MNVTRAPIKMNDTILYNISSLLWFIFGFSVKLYLDAQFNQYNFNNQNFNQELEETNYIGSREFDNTKDQIIAQVELLLQEAISLEESGDIYSYKISAAIINKLDTLFVQLEDLKND